MVFKQSKGIRLIEANDLISDSYFKEALSDFSMIEKLNQKWKAVTSYYSCYNAVYAILVKIGIKCEIPDCTLALMQLLGFDKADIQFLESLKNDRVNVQYYLKTSSLHIDTNQVLEFLNKCKQISKDLNDYKINEIREVLKNKSNYK